MYVYVNIYQWKCNYAADFNLNQCMSDGIVSVAR